MLVSIAAPARTAIEVVATGMARPLALAVHGTTLLVLEPSSDDEAAGELFRIDLAGPLPLDLTGRRGERIPFPGGHLAVLGSLAVDPGTGHVFVGEENGRSIYLLADDGRLILYAAGLHDLVGGSAFAFDARRRLVVGDFVDRNGAEADRRVPHGLEQFRREDYRGPVAFRLTLDPDIPLPRRLDVLAPFFPRGWGARAHTAFPSRLVAVAPLGADDVAALTSAGELLRITRDRRLVAYAKLPPGQYLRGNMAAGGDGTLYVTGGLWMNRLFRVAPDGSIVTLVRGLRDPEGVAVDAGGRVYVAESSAGRILRLSPR